MRIDYEAEVGKVYGRLTFKKFLYRDEKGRPICRFTCSCDGHELDLNFYSVRRGNTLSCGCYRSEYVANKNFKHGLRHSPLYSIWDMIIQRCYNENNKDYHYYGAVGIKMSEDWRNNFKNFYNDLIDSYNEHVGIYGKNNTSIDRIDPDGNYCKENCKWATWEEQNDSRHKRKFKDNTEVTNVSKETLAP